MTRTTGCDEFGEELSALLDGELTPEREAGVRAHVAGCAACRAELAALERVDPWLARVAAPAPSARLSDALHARIAAEAVAPRRRWLARPAALAAWAAAAALALYFGVGRQRTPLAPEGAQGEGPLAEAELDALPADELAVGLELDTAQDLEVIANLELLEALVALDAGRG